MSRVAGANMIALFPGVTLVNAGNSTTTRVDASTERVAASFVATTTSPISAVDLCLNFSGNSSDVVFRVGIQSDSANAPDGTYLGTADALFAGQNATGIVWIGAQTLMDAATHLTPTTTGNLVVGTKYWVVVDVTTAGSIGAAVYIELRRLLGPPPFDFYTLYTGTWAAATQGAGMFVCTHASGAFTGYPWTTSATNHASAPDIFIDTGVTNYQGLRFKVGAQISIAGVLLNLTKTGTPGVMNINLYEGAVLKASLLDIPVAATITGVTQFWPFASPVLVAADTNLYLVIDQEGTSGSNDYDTLGVLCNTTYVSIAMPPDWRFVYGTTANPTTLTVDSTAFLPRVIPVVMDPAADFDQAAAGGGAPYEPVFGIEEMN